MDIEELRQMVEDMSSVIDTLKKDIASLRPQKGTIEPVRLERIEALEKWKGEREERDRKLRAIEDYGPRLDTIEKAFETLKPTIDKFIEGSMAERQMFATFKRDAKEEIARLRRMVEEKKDAA